MPKISALTSASSANATDELAIVQSSTTKRIQRQNLGVGVDELDVTNRASGSFLVTNLDASGTVRAGGVKIVTETSPSIADDGTHAFSTITIGSNGSGFYGIMCETYGGVLNQAFFGTGGAQQVSMGTWSNVDFGGASNPDTDTKLNVWVSSSVINIKNRLGGACVFTLVALLPN